MCRFKVKVFFFAYVDRSWILKTAFYGLGEGHGFQRPATNTHEVYLRYPLLPDKPIEIKSLLIVTLSLGPAVNPVYKQAQKQVRPVGRTIYVISAIMAVLTVAFLSIIVYLKVQHRKSALPQKQNTSSGSISKSTQSTVQQPSFDLKQSISEIKSCVFNQVGCVIFSIASCFKRARSRPTF